MRRGPAGVAVILAILFGERTLARAEETDPKEILRKSAEAIAALNTASYHIESYGGGSMAERVPKWSGEVSCVRGDFGKLAVRIVGKSTIGSREDAFKVYFKGDQGTFCQPESEAAPCPLRKMGGGLRQFKEFPCLILLDNHSFNAEIQRIPKLRNHMNVGGVDCYAVRTTVRDRDVYIWYIGVSDLLPHRVDHVVRGGGVGATVCELTQLKLNPAITEDELAGPESVASRASKDAEGADFTFEWQLGINREGLWDTEAPKWLTLPRWKDANTLDRAVSGWLIESRKARSVTSYDDFGQHVKLTNAATQAKERLWDAPRVRTGLGSEPGSLKSFEFGLNAVHYLAALGMEEAIEDLASSSSATGLVQKDKLGLMPVDYAAIYGRTAALSILWRRSRGVHAQTPRPLCFAAAMGHADSVQALLTAGAAADAKDERGNTALEYALVTGNEKTANVLFTALFQPSGEKPAELRPLKEFIRPVFAAIRSKRIDSLRQLAKHVDLTMSLEATDIGLSIPESASGSDRENLLHFAAANGDKTVIKYLINEIHLDATSFDGHGRPPLFFASSREIAEVLLAADPELIDHTDEFERSVVHYMAGRDSPDALTMILQKRPKLLDATDKFDRVPIEYAVMSNSPGSLAVLVDAGANLWVRINDSTTALGGMVDTVVITALGKRAGEWLVSPQATLLHVAARLGCKETAEVLARKGLTDTAIDACHRTPLLVALIHKQSDFAKWLIKSMLEHERAKNGKDNLLTFKVNQESENGCRPIHFAASNGNDELVELLVQAGADISAPVKPHLGIVGTGVEFFKGCGLGLETGATAYDLARTNKHWKLADWIKKHGGKSGMAKKE